MRCSTPLEKSWPCFENDYDDKVNAQQCGHDSIYDLTLIGQLKSFRERGLKS